MVLNEVPVLRKNTKLFLSYNRSTLVKEDNTKYSLNNDGAKLIKEFSGEKSFIEIIVKVLKKQIHEVHDEEMNKINIFIHCCPIKKCKSIVSH